MNPKELSQFPLGDKNDAFATYFVGQSYLHMLSTQQVAIANVTFEPGCRNHWHIHRAKSGGGQILLVTAGRGYYQKWGEKARELHPGDVVNIPANVKHWHGAAPDSWFAHLAVEVPAENGRQKYAVLQSAQNGMTEKYVRILRDGFSSMDMAQNILVLKTVSGMAMAVAAALDAMNWNEIVGCIAGDDTIMCAVRTVDDTILLMEKIKKLLEQ